MGFPESSTHDRNPSGLARNDPAYATVDAMACRRSTT